MARSNRPRSIGGERNLAERIRRERALRGWSPADLAQKMTSAGCSIATSAIYKIEDEEKPRKISVDELLAFAHVFSTTVDDLLTQVDVLDQEKAQKLIAQMDAAEDQLDQAIAQIATSYSELLDLNVFEPEIAEYVMGHRKVSVSDEEVEDVILVSLVDDDGTERPLQTPRLNRALRELYMAIAETGLEIGEEAAMKSVRGGWKPQIEVDHGER